MVQVLRGVTHFVGISLASFVAWWLAMSQTRFRWFGYALFLGAFVFLVVAAAFRFLAAYSVFDALFGFVPTLNQTPAMCFVATYWMASCFRIRGWRFTRVLRTSVRERSAAA